MNEQYMQGQYGQDPNTVIDQNGTPVFVQPQIKPRKQYAHTQYQHQETQQIFNETDLRSTDTLVKAAKMKDFGSYLGACTLIMALFLGFLKIMNTPPSDSEILQQEQQEYAAEPQLIIYDDNGKTALYSENEEEAAPPAKNKTAKKTNGNQAQANPVLHSEPQDIIIQRSDGRKFTCTRVEMIKGKPDVWCVDEFGQPLKTVNQMQMEYEKQSSAQQQRL